MATRKMQTGGKTKATTSPTRMATTAIAQAKKKATAGKGIVRWHGENTGVYFPSYMLHPDNHQPLPKYEKQISDSLQKRGISVKEYKKGGTTKTVKTGTKKYQTGGAKINGYDVYQGPVTKQMSTVLAKNYPAGVGPRVITPEVTEADNMRRMGENLDRIQQRDQTASKKVGKVKKRSAGGVVTKMQKGGTAHPGFKAAQAGIAAKQGVSKKAAGAILASAARKASPKAKAANPRLKRVKG